MNRFEKILLLTLLTLSAVSVMAELAAPPRGEWSCVALTPRHLALTGDYSELQLKLFRERMEARKRARNRLPQWAKDFRFHTSGTEAIAMYRPRVVEMLRQSPQISIVSPRGELKIRRTGYWMSPIGQARFPDEDGRERISNNADVAHYLFIELDRPLDDGEKLDITLPAGEKIEFTYRRSAPTPIIRINQLGYMPTAPKFAYLGSWLGTAGPMPLHGEFSGAKFELVDAATGRTVFSGELKPRPADPVNKNGTPFTGEEVLDMDFSPCSATGRYYLVVDKIGRSEEFRIGDDTMAEAFYVHARGLYQQRCGIAKEKPYTNWTMPSCHQQCARGNFPPNDAHYHKGKGQRQFGFRDAAGKAGVRVEPQNFQTREVGTFKPIIPRLTPIHDRIGLDSTPWRTFAPSWHDFAAPGSPAAGYLYSPSPKGYCSQTSQASSTAPSYSPLAEQISPSRVLTG